MKQIRTILVLLLCLCMLPLNALAYTVEPVTVNDTVTYTPEETGLYAVSVAMPQAEQDALPYPVRAPGFTVVVKSGDTAVKPVDFNVFLLAADTEYNVQIRKDFEEGESTAGWSLSIDKVDVQPLSLNADTFLVGEWFSFAPEADGDYVFNASARPVFIEIFAPGTQGGDWQGYADDKRDYLEGVAEMETGYAQYAAAQEQYEQARLTLETHRAAYEAAKAQYESEKLAYDAALEKLDNYQKMLDYANDAGWLDEGSAFDQAKQDRYERIVRILKGLSWLPIELPFTLDKEAVDALPESYQDLPAHLTAKIEENQEIITHFESLQADAEAQLAEFEAAEKQLAEVESQLAEAKAMLDQGEAELEALRVKIQNDADAIMDGADPLAASDASELALQDAAWLRENDDALTVSLKAGTVYTVHVLSGAEAAMSVTGAGTEPPEPPTPVINTDALRDAIEAATQIDRDKFTAESLAALDAAVAAAQQVLENAPSQEAVDAAAQAINDAIAALQEKEVTPPTPDVDKSVLAAIIEAAEKLNTEEYTAESVAAVTSALEAAKAVMNDENADQTAVDNAVKALQTALKGLEKEEQEEPSLIRRALQKLIEEAEKLPLDNYTDESAQALRDALANAKAVLADPAAGLSEISDALTQLREAYSGLVEKPEAPADWTALDNAIAAAEAVDRSKYTDESLAELDRALDVAKTVKQNDAAQQKDIDAAAKMLTDAIAALEEKEVTPDPNVDKSALQALTNALSNLTLDRSKYTEESLAAFDQALQAAKAVLADPRATQAQVDAARSNLLAAFNGLKEKGETPDPGKCDGGANCPSRKFVDVDRSPDCWYHEPVDWAVVNNITAGVNATHFDPDGKCTRAQAVTFLWRAKGMPEPKTTVNPFSDVSEDSWYYKPVLWAVENNITAGVGGGRFDPDGTCTRSQIVTFLWRTAGQPAPQGTATSFSDVPADVWYADAVAWAVENNITSGVGGGRFDPDGTCIRSQIVTFLFRAFAE